jgi:drug/metabolite transporter (DMT)-like permease
MTKYIGELAGITTSLLYALNAIFVTRASQRVGSIITNRVRVTFAVFYLMIINLIFFGQILPFGAGTDRWTWLALSGIIGLAVGDALLFQSFILVGPRLGTLIFSLSTVFGALEAWFIFGETLRLPEIIGITLALAGILWVVLEHGNNNEQRSHHLVSGITYATLSAICQATGFVLSKQGMGGSLSPFQANAIRMLAALLTLIVIMAFQKQTGHTFQVLRENIYAVRLLALAALVGPVLAVSLSLLSVQHAEVGVASVLTSLSPVFMLPFSHFFFKEQLGWQAVAGTVLAMAGVVVLFLY